MKRVGKITVPGWKSTPKSSFSSSGFRHCSFAASSINVFDSLVLQCPVSLGMPSRSIHEPVHRRISLLRDHRDTSLEPVLRLISHTIMRSKKAYHAKTLDGVDAPRAASDDDDRLLSGLLMRPVLRHGPPDFRVHLLLVGFDDDLAVFDRRREGP